MNLAGVDYQRFRTPYLEGRGEIGRAGRVQRADFAQSRCVSGRRAAGLRSDHRRPYPRRTGARRDSARGSERRALLYAVRRRPVSASGTRPSSSRAASGPSGCRRAWALLRRSRCCACAVPDRQRHSRQPEALEAVLADARGPLRPNPVPGRSGRLRRGSKLRSSTGRAQMSSAIVRGNHDKVCAGLESLDTYRPAARAAAEWTANALTPENRAYLERLPRGPLPYEGFDLVHGSPVDEDEYLLTRSTSPTIAHEIETPADLFRPYPRAGRIPVARSSVDAIDRHRTLSSSRATFIW